MDMECIYPTDEEIRELKSTFRKSKCKQRHNIALNGKYNAMNISKFGVLMPEDILLPTSAYNSLRETIRQASFPGKETRSNGKSKGKGKGKNKTR